MKLLLPRAADGFFNGAKQQRIRPVQPGTKASVVQAIGQFAKAIEVKAGVGDAQADPRGVNGVDLLLDVICHGHEEQRLAKVGGFAHGLKPGGAGDIFAVGHHAEKLFSVEAVKSQRGIVAGFRWGVRFVVQAMNHVLRIPLVPGDDLSGIAVVEEVGQYEPAIGVGGQFKELPAQKRRADGEIGGRQIRRFIKRQGQPGRGGTHQTHIPLQAELLQAQAGRAHVIGMSRHELMRDRDDRWAMTTGQRVNACQRLEVVDDYVRLGFAHDGAQHPQAAPVRRKVAHEAGERGRQVNLAAVLIGKVERRNGRARQLHGRRKEWRHLSARAQAADHFRDLVASPFERLLHRHSLGHVTAALAENAEHYFHRSG